MCRRTALVCAILLALNQLPSCGSDSSPGEKCDSTSCGQHGSCDDSTGEIRCTCDQGWSGASCDQCAEGYQDYGDGACLPADPCADDTACAEQNRECENQQGQAVCGDCLAGYHLEDEECVEDLTCLENTCAGHGTCDDSTGMVVCTCDPGYAGDHCDACAEGYTFWPPGGDECVADPCDPDPCDMAHAVPGGCVQTGLDSFVCACENNYSWDGQACQPACIDADQDGYGEGTNCLDVDCDDGDATINPGHAEICDGKDNDCDTATDEDLTPPDCPLPDTGVCQGATAARTCEGSDGWSECDYTSDYQVSESICDDLDNDCDSETDEAYPDRGLACDGDDSDLCAHGTWTCTSAGDALECVNESSTDLTEVCNGLDDDCDGQTDEDVTEPVEPCQNVVPGVGTCTGDWHCQGVDEWVCDALVPGPELCDGLDNDCDPGTVDGVADPLIGAPCDGDDSDLCEEGIYSCPAGTLTCSDDTSSTVDLCDLVDNDCDPASNDGDEDPLVGTACDGEDSDLCPEGLHYCQDGEIKCDDLSADDLDVCDGQDNDCDSASADGSEDPLLGAQCDGEDTDVCLEGTYSCQAAALVCSDNTSSTPELCNGADDDCDGSTDEDFVVDTNPACADGTIVIGAVSGDTLSEVKTARYYDERWLTVYINENNVLPQELTATISLWSPPGVDFDLHVYCDNCTGNFVGSSTVKGLTGHWDTISVRSEDGQFFDDDYWVVIEVEYIESNKCAFWDLTVEGNTPVAATTCF